MKRKLLMGGSGRRLPIPDVDVTWRDWALDRDVSDFQSLDIGLYPVPDDAFAASKSGFKAVQYLSVGVPYIGSPVGLRVVQRIRLDARWPVVYFGRRLTRFERVAN